MDLIAAYIRYTHAIGENNFANHIMKYLGILIRVTPFATDGIGNDKLNGYIARRTNKYIAMLYDGVLEHYLDVFDLKDIAIKSSKRGHSIAETDVIAIRENIRLRKHLFEAMT